METKFDIEELKRELSFAPLNNHYEAYRRFNPTLSQRMYKHLYNTCALWKIRCGKKVELKYPAELLRQVWYLDTPDNETKERYL